MRASAISSTDVLFADSVHCEKNKRFLVTFCRLAKSYPLLGAEAFALKHQHQKHSHWIPAFAGMTSGESGPTLTPTLSRQREREKDQKLDSRLRGNDERRVGAPPSPQPSP